MAPNTLLYGLLGVREEESVRWEFVRDQRGSRERAVEIFLLHRSRPWLLLLLLLCPDAFRKFRVGFSRRESMLMSRPGLQSWGGQLFLPLVSPSRPGSILDHLPSFSTQNPSNRRSPLLVHFVHHPYRLPGGRPAHHRSRNRTIDFCLRLSSQLLIQSNAESG